MLRALFLIEDGAFVFDNRVRREAATLQRAGAKVSVICPAYPGEKWSEDVDGVHVFRYWKPALGSGLASHALEYLTSLLAMTVLAALVALRHGFDVLHAANPPDLLWLVAAPYKLLGKKFIFDHHDLVPELFEDRFRGATGRFLPLLRMMERMNFLCADHVISTNESYRRVAIERGSKVPEEVTVVRNGPDARDFPEGVSNPRIRALGRIVVGYLGNMNPQDGVDRFLEMARIIRVEQGRRDIGFVMVGQGDAFDDLVRLRDEWGLTDAVRMTGRMPWSDVLAALRATDICVQPDPPGRLNDHSTMNKLMEYMMLGKATVAYDLHETRVSGGEAAVYVCGDSAQALADEVLQLADDYERRQALGNAARRRVEDVLAWRHQSRRLLDVYERLFPGRLNR